MATSQHVHDPRRPQRLAQQPLLDEPVQVAPYLTHVVAHHGQLTLVPPQNAGRIRKTKSAKKKRQPSTRDRRLDDEEPRFTTAVPASSSRKLHPAPAHIRTRKHAISAPSPTTPTTPGRHDPIPDDQSIPDYPPPSFEDAIASPHVPPHLSSIASSHSPSTLSNPATTSPPPSQHPYASHVPSTSSATLLSSATAYHDSPAASQLSLARPTNTYPALDPQYPLLRPAAASSATLLSPTVTTSDSTALSDMPLLRPPRARPVSSPLVSSSVRPVPSSPIRLTSPSTTTLISSAIAVRDSPAPPQVTLSSPQHSIDSESDLEPESPLVEPLSPLSSPSSPHPHYRGSISTVSDVVEELTFEPYQRWSADRRLGFSLEQRVQREFDRRKTSEARQAPARAADPEAHIASASATPNSSMPSTPPGSPGPFTRRRCSHCGSVKRRCGDTQTIDEHSGEDSDNEDLDEDDDDTHFSAAGHTSSLPLPRGRGQSPYLHPGPGHARTRTRLGSHSPEPGSPLSPSVSFFKMPSAWASSVTLSLATVLGPHKSPPSTSSTSTAASSPPPMSTTNLLLGANLKRKESFGVKRLFGSLKGKERERERQREQEYAQLPLRPSSTSISSSESTTESVDGWEVVGSDSPSPSPSPQSSRTSPAPTSPTSASPVSPARLSPEASSPTSESARAAGAFLNRPVRHRPATLPLTDNATSTMSPVTPHPATPTSPSMSHAAAVAAARPYLPEKSPLRLIASANHLRQTHAQALHSPVSTSPVATTPRALRPSPSVIWKAPAGAGTPGGQNSPVQRSPLSQSPYQRQPQPQQQAPSLAYASSQFQQTPQAPAGPRASPSAAPTPAPSSPARTMIAISETFSPLVRSAPTLRETVLTSATSPPSTPLRRRRAITPPPTHRRVMLACDTSATTTPERVPVSHDAEIVVEEGVGEVGEPSNVPESLSIEQLFDREAPRAPTPMRTPTTPSRAAFAMPATPVTPGSTPTTPTFGPGGSQHYRGRPLPQPPAERDGEANALPLPIKRISDGAPVNRMPEVQVAGGEEVPPPPPPPAVQPTTSSVFMSVTAAPSPASVPVVLPAAAPVAPSPQMERSDSGDSVVEDARAAEEGPRPEFLEITDLDVLASRLVEGQRDGRNYEDLLLVSEIIGPAANASAPSSATTPATVQALTRRSEKATIPYIGTVEIERRRVLKDGRVKLKLSLLGVAVDRCGVCLSQFRRGERGALTPVCKHSFHEACLRRWLRTAGVCPICRMVLSMDD
ncbi:hypothetical protein VTO73DRAFT_6784 [Trametes versicolor]